MKNLIKGVGIVVLILFFSLFFSRYNNYYENKKVLTDEAIERFERDLKDGKEIVASNYLEEEKNYNNKASKIGLKTSKAIEKTFNKGLGLIMKYLESLQNS